MKRTKTITFMFTRLRFVLCRLRFVLCIFGVMMFLTASAFAATYTIGTGETYANLEALRAAGVLADGDKIILTADDKTLTAPLFTGSGTITFGGTGSFVISPTARDVQLFYKNGTGSINLKAENNTNLKLSGFVMADNISNKDGAVLSAQKVTLSGDGSIEFAGNTSQKGNGGAIAADIVEIKGGDNVFRGNYTKTGSGGSGGAVYGDTSVLVSGGTNTFSANQSAMQGGAIFAGTDLKITDGTNIFSGNSAIKNGGAINSRSYLEVSGGTNYFIKNNAKGDGSSSINGKGGAVYVEQSALFRASSGNIMFQGNVDNDAVHDDGIANAIYMHNHLDAAHPSNSLTLAATGENSLLFYDPITSRRKNTANQLLLLEIAINPDSGDTGKVVFDGSTASTTKPENFISAIYGDTTVSYGTLALLNGVTYGAADTTGSFTLESNATLLTNGTKTNKINAKTINLNGGTLAFDLNDYSGTMLSLNGTTITGNPDTVDIRGLRGGGTFDLASRNNGSWNSAGIGISVDGDNIAGTRAAGKLTLQTGGTGNEILQLESTAANGAVRWTGGAAGGDWDQNLQNWDTSSISGDTSNLFLSGDAVVFDGSSGT
ncbi:MAG: hypothetical protein ACRC2T_03690, partial [Thermoguttaceae bacterium]